MKLSQLLNGIFVPSNDLEITGIACDTRKIKPGFAFVCINGVNVDGHKYASKALENGAALIIAERDLGMDNQIILEDTRSVWAKMSANWFGHPADDMKIIGITGTNGKTSSSYMMKQALELCGYKVGLIGTIQSLIGNRPIPACHTTPEAYELHHLFRQMADAHCTHVVMEVSSHALAQCRVDGIQFEAGIFTNLTQDHLDYHKTMEDYCEAKKKLFLNCKKAFLNADDSWFDKISQDLPCRVYTFSCKNSKATYRAEQPVCRPDGVSYEFVGPDVRGPITLGIPGEFSVYNSLGVLSCLLELGVPFDLAQKALSSLEGVRGRAELVKTGKGFPVIIDYAHTPDGLEKIFSAIKPSVQNRLIAVFGAAGKRDITKRAEMGAIAARYADVLFVTSDNPRTEDEDFIIQGVKEGIPDNTETYCIADRFEAIRKAVQMARPGDTVLLAGKGHESCQVLNNGMLHIDEREVVAEALGYKNKQEMKEC